MTLWERIINQRLRDIVIKHFGWKIWFQSWGRTTDATFVISTLCEKYREGNKPLDMVFFDLKKTYDTVPREVLCICMHKRNIPARCVHRTSAGYYQDAATRVKSERGFSEHLRLGLASIKGRHLARSHSSCW